jgi:hypothetical protein
VPRRLSHQLDLKFGALVFLDQTNFSPGELVIFCARKFLCSKFHQAGHQALLSYATSLLSPLDPVFR